MPQRIFIHAQHPETLLKIQDNLGFPGTCGVRGSSAGWRRLDLLNTSHVAVTLDQKAPHIAALLAGLGAQSAHERASLASRLSPVGRAGLMAGSKAPAGRHDAPPLDILPLTGVAFADFENEKAADVVGAIEFLSDPRTGITVCVAPEDLHATLDDCDPRPIAAADKIIHRPGARALRRSEGLFVMDADGWLIVDDASTSGAPAQTSTVNCSPKMNTAAIVDAIGATRRRANPGSDRPGRPPVRLRLLEAIARPDLDDILAAAARLDPVILQLVRRFETQDDLDAAASFAHRSAMFVQVVNLLDAATTSRLDRPDDVRGWILNTRAAHGALRRMTGILEIRMDEVAERHFDAGLDEAAEIDMATTVRTGPKGTACLPQGAIDRLARSVTVLGKSLVPDYPLTVRLAVDAPIRAAWPLSRKSTPMPLKAP